MTQPEGFSIRVLEPESHDLRRALQELGVDPYGVRIMAPKGVPYVVRLGPVSYPASNILKQEMLSLGGDCALPRDVVTGKVRKTDCLLIGNASHLRRLGEKLKQQPFGLSGISARLAEAIENYEKKSFILDLRGRKLAIGRPPLIMGILNLTPDSFSGDGMYGRDTGEVVERALAAAAGGAGILDIGGESSRPGAKPVPLKEELRRVIPAVKALAKKVKIPLSVDTWKAEVARQSLDNGASMINDITGLRDPKMAGVCASRACGVVLMHMKGTPSTMRRLARYSSLLGEVHASLARTAEKALQAGIRADRVVLDPGICFAKDAEQNLELLRRFRELKTLGYPLMAGVSRKSFIGKLLGVNASERLAGTLGACCAAAANGADILRVHDVTPTAQAVKTLCAILNNP